MLAKRASQADMTLAWTRLLSEARRTRLVRWLWLFAHVRPPQPHPRLLELAAGDDRQLARAAVQVAPQPQTPRRSDCWHARSPPAESVGASDGRLLGLFEHNLQPGDAPVLLACARLALNREEVHAASLDLRAVARRNPGTELIPVLRWACDATPALTAAACFSPH